MPMQGRRGGGLVVGFCLTALAACALLPSSPAAAKPDGRIISGQPIPIEQAPWQVAIALNRDRYQGGSAARFACGGTLIAPNVVLTAAHCVYNTPVQNGLFNGPEQFEVYVGRARLSSGQGQVIPVAGVAYLVQDAAGAIQLESVGGPDVGTQLYTAAPVYFWDLAVLSLSAPASVGTPIQLAGADERATWGGGVQALLSGWGAQTQAPPYTSSDDLYAVQVPIASDEACTQNHGTGFDIGSQFCAGPPEGGFGGCRGDSGGPLAVPVEQSSTLGVRLAGLVSLGGPDGCSQAGFIDQYVRVSDAPIRDAIVRGIQPYVATPLVGSGARPYGAPDTVILKHPKRRTRHRKARIQFSATEPATFTCTLDDAPAAVCATPYVQKVGGGKHAFSVVATDSLGLVDASPATFSWKVKHKRHHHHH
jgi:trypsin